MKLNKTTQIFIIIILFFSISVGFFYFLFAQIKSMNESASHFIKEFESLAIEQEQFRTIQRLAEETEEQRNTIDTYFLTDNGIIVFLEKLESLQSITGATIDVSSISESEGESSVADFLNISIAAQGSWDSLYHFLVLLESMPYRIDFSQVQITGGERVVEEEGQTVSVSAWRGNFSFAIATLK